MKIRKAQKKDTENIVEGLWVPFMEYCKGLDDFSGIRPDARSIFRKHLGDIIDNDDNVVYIAEDNSSVLGFIKAGKISRPPVYDITEAGEISDLFVFPENREGGIGHGLVRNVEEWFRSNGMNIALLKVHYANKQGRIFWESLGYKSHMIKMMKYIGDGGDFAKRTGTPRLVVLCGFPSSGKSQVAEYMNSKHGFNVLCTDKTREEMGYRFNAFSDELHEEERNRFHEMEEIMMKKINLRKHEHLIRNEDVVIDSCALYKRTRDDFLLSHIAEKYLLFLEVDDDILIQRNMEKDFTFVKEMLDVLKRKYWEEPSPSKDYTLLRYHNNVPGDLEFLLRDLDSGLFP